MWQRTARMIAAALVACGGVIATGVMREQVGAQGSQHTLAASAPASSSTDAADATTSPPTTETPTTAAPTTTTPPAPATTRPPVTAAPRTTTTTAKRPAPTTAPAPAPAKSTATGVATHYAFMATDQGRPMRYDPCTPIHYVVNSALAPASGMADLTEALRRITVANGLQFAFDGYTDETPASHRGVAEDPRYPGQWPPVLIGWVKPGQSDLFSGGALGEGGSTWYGVPGSQVYVTGVVALDATQNGQLAAGFGGDSEGGVLMHEVAHVVGLDHVNDQTQIMYPTVTNKPSVFGAGDLAGLQLLGRPAGCMAVPPPPWKK